MLRHLPPEKQALLTELLDALKRIDGMKAIVLGGSYASGTHRPDSDLDLGLYYAETAPFDIEQIRAVANQYEKATVTEFYDWGQWVNGGAWIYTHAGKVDFLYRNIDQVRTVIQEAHAGISRADYLQQPTYGFYSVIYLAETKICLPLYDPDGVIADFKAQVATYPPALKQKSVQDSLWMAQFTLEHAQGHAARGDVYNTVGCMTRALSLMTQALFALNETYFISDKKALDTIETFALKPDHYAARVSEILSHPGANRDDLTRTIDTLWSLWREVAALAQNDYRPRY